MQVVKYNYQNIEIFPTADEVLVKNRNLFTDTAAFGCSVSLHRNGWKVLELPMEISVPPLSEGRFPLPEAVAKFVENEMFLGHCLAQSAGEMPEPPLHGADRGQTGAVPEPSLCAADRAHCHMHEAADDIGSQEKVPRKNGAPALASRISGEYAVTVSFYLKRDTLWARRGHEVAFGQYVYGAYPAGAAAAEPSVFAVPDPDTLPYVSGGIGGLRQKAFHYRGSIEIVRGWSNFGVRGEHFEALFSRLNGGMVSYRYGGREMLKTMPLPDFWRAPTDIDAGCGMPARYGQWKLASLYVGKKDADGRDVPEPSLREERDCAVITYFYALPTEPKSSCRMEYRVYADGTVQVRLMFDPVEGLAPMPLFGVSMKLDADYDRIEWYGLGSEETYCDRTGGAKLGIYHSTVQESLAKYLAPQETGNKTGVRWARVTDARGRGLLFAAGAARAENARMDGAAGAVPISGKGVASEHPQAVPNSGRSVDPEQAQTLPSSGSGLAPERTQAVWQMRTEEDTRIPQQDCPAVSAAMEFSALPYTSHELENAAHPYELPRVHYTVVRTALAQLGLGGDDSWGARPHEEYRLKAGEPLEFCFWFRGI